MPYISSETLGKLFHLPILQCLSLQSLHCYAFLLHRAVMRVKEDCIQKMPQSKYICQLSPLSTSLSSSSTSLPLFLPPHLSPLSHSLFSPLYPSATTIFFSSHAPDRFSPPDHCMCLSLPRILLCLSFSSQHCLDNSFRSCF